MSSRGKGRKGLKGRHRQKSHQSAIASLLTSKPGQYTSEQIKDLKKLALNQQKANEAAALRQAKEALKKKEQTAALSQMEGAADSNREPTPGRAQKTSNPAEEQKTPDAFNAAMVASTMYSKLNDMTAADIQRMLETVQEAYRENWSAGRLAGGLNFFSAHLGLYINRNPQISTAIDKCRQDNDDADQMARSAFCYLLCDCERDISSMQEGLVVNSYPSLGFRLLQALAQSADLKWLDDSASDLDTRANNIFTSLTSQFPETDVVDSAAIASAAASISNGGNP
jgi:hypothetical protein